MTLHEQPRTHTDLLVGDRTSRTSGATRGTLVVDTTNFNGPYPLDTKRAPTIAINFILIERVTPHGMQGHIAYDVPVDDPKS